MYGPLDLKETVAEYLKDEDEGVAGVTPNQEQTDLGATSLMPTEGDKEETDEPTIVGIN